MKIKFLDGAEQKSLTLGVDNRMQLRLGRASFKLSEASQTGSDWEVTLLVEGWSLNEVYYSREIVEKFRDLIDAKPGGKVPIQLVFLGEKWSFGGDPSHPTERMEEESPGAAGNFVGFADKPAVVLEGDRAKLVAHIHIFESVIVSTNGQELKLRELLREAHEVDALEMLGLSLNADGIVREGTAEGRSGVIVEDIPELNSWEIVRDPAAGGAFNRLVASVKRKGDNKAMKYLMRMLQAIAKGLDLDADEMDEKSITEAVLKHERVKAGSFLHEQLERVIELLEAEESDEREKEILELVASVSGRVHEGLEDPEDDEEEEAVADSDSKDEETEEEATAVAESDERMKTVIAEFEKRMAAMEAKVSDAEERAAQAEMKAVAEALVNGAKGLPEASKKFLLADFDGQKLTEKKIKEKIRMHREMLQSLESDGHVVDLGAVSKESQLREGRDHLDKRMMALDLALKYKPTDEEAKLYEGIKPVRSIRQFYVDFTGDEDVTGTPNPRKRRITEEITTSTFTYALGTSMNKSMQKQYMEYMSPWRNFVTIESVDDFKLQEAIQWGSLGDIAAVSEGATYAEISVAADFEATFTPTKRGGIVSVTRETIINDDLRFMARYPGELARSANSVLEQFVYDLVMNVSGGVINAGTIYTGGALYTAGQSNLTTDALDSDSLDAAQVRLFNQTDPGSSKKLGLAPGCLIIPRELRTIAIRLQNDDKVPEGAENASNTLKGSLKEVIVSGKLRADANNWYMCADPMDIDCLLLGFVGGQEVPVLVTASAENVGVMFTNDKIQYKVRHEYGGCIPDFRAWQGGIVA